MPAPAAEMKKMDAFSGGRLRPANSARAKKQDGITNPAEEMHGRKHCTQKQGRRGVDSGDGVIVSYATWLRSVFDVLASLLNELTPRKTAS